MPRTVLRRAPGKRAGGPGLGGGDPVAGIGRIGVAAIAIVGLQGVADHVVAGQQLTPGCHGKQVRVLEAHAGVEVGDHHVGVPKRDAPGGLDIDRRGNRAARRSQVPLPYGRAAAGYAVGVERVIRRGLDVPTLVRHGVFDVAFPRPSRRPIQWTGLFQVFSVLQSAAERSRPSKRIEVRVLLVALASTLWLAGTAAQSQPISREQAAQSLSQADAQARREAAGRLGEVGTTADVPRLVETLRDPDADTRDQAEQALWRIWARSGDPETDRLYQAGIEQMNAGDLQQSIITFTRIVELKP